MRSRLFHAVVASGLALAVPLTLSACAGDDSRRPTPTDGGGTSSADEVAEDGAAHGDGAHDAAADADGGWPPTK